MLHYRRASQGLEQTLSWLWTLQTCHALSTLAQTCNSMSSTLQIEEEKKMRQALRKIWLALQESQEKVVEFNSSLCSWWCCDKRPNSDDQSPACPSLCLYRKKNIWAHPSSLWLTPTNLTAHTHSEYFALSHEGLLNCSGVEWLWFTGLATLIHNTHTHTRPHTHTHTHSLITTLSNRLIFVFILIFDMRIPVTANEKSSPPSDTHTQATC